MIHQCKGLIAENENENIAGGEGDGLSLVLEFQKRRSANHQPEAYPRNCISRVAKTPWGCRLQTRINRILNSHRSKDFRQRVHAVFKYWTIGHVLWTDGTHESQFYSIYPSVRQIFTWRKNDRKNVSL